MQKKKKIIPLSSYVFHTYKNRMHADARSLTIRKICIRENVFFEYESMNFVAYLT